MIRATGLRKSFGDFEAVKGIDVDVRRGEAFGFLGPNGAGKSTTMKILLDLARADGGRAAIGDLRYRDLADPARTVGVVLEHAFHPGRSGRNHLRILADASGIPSSRVAEVLALVGLTEAADRRAGAYSLGMRQRLGLAGALLGDPPVLVLDEPGNGLDPQGLRDLRDLLRARAAAGGTVFVSSHLLAEIEHLADDVVVVHRGRLVTTGALSTLQERGCTVRASSPERLAGALQRSGARVRPAADGGLLVTGMELAAIGDTALAAGIAVHELSPSVGSLEDLFMQWTGDGPRSAAPPVAPSKEEEVVLP
jgi:ABC-2 type transport system ATP-binding protein